MVLLKTHLTMAILFFILFPLYLSLLDLPFGLQCGLLYFFMDFDGLGNENELLVLLYF
jgi:hypothetical protein